jgi:hypothetical protein
LFNHWAKAHAATGGQTIKARKIGYRTALTVEESRICNSAQKYRRVRNRRQIIFVSGFLSASVAKFVSGLSALRYKGLVCRGSCANA